jgi:hypothetical protein
VEFACAKIKFGGQIESDMKVPRTLKFACLFCAAMLQTATGGAQLATNVTITNLQGRVYRNITLDHTNKLGVIWTAADGSLGQFKYTDLAMDYWEKLNLSNSAQKYVEAAALQKEQQQERERQVRTAQEEAARQKAELNRSVQDLLSATNSEEQKIDAMQDNPTNMSPDEKSARDGLLKALLDISSSTSVGVNRNDYGTLLAKANSALAFAQTKLPVDRHGKFLLCAAKAIGYYSKANDDWSDYFKYDWQREQDETLMSASDFYDLRQGGLPVDASSYKKDTEGEGHLFDVPFKASLNLYWQAADIYIHKMQRDAVSLP